LLQRDIVNARAAYQDFLALCEDADLDIPVMKLAKAEYASCSSLCAHAKRAGLFVHCTKKRPLKR